MQTSQKNEEYSGGEWKEGMGFSEELAKVPDHHEERKLGKDIGPLGKINSGLGEYGLGDDLVEKRGGGSEKKPKKTKGERTLSEGGGLLLSWGLDQRTYPHGVEKKDILGVLTDISSVGSS